MGFIKATLRGHEFEPAYDVELTQIIRAFQAFLADHSPEFALEERDIVRRDIHEWDDYFRIDVGRYIGDRGCRTDTRPKATINCRTSECL